MAGNLAGLIILLTENEKALAEFGFALTEEQGCIVDLDLERLAENGGRKEQITARLTRAREECRAAMQHAGCELGLDESSSLSAIIDAAPEAEQARLRPLQRRLMRLVRSLERQHDMNRKMLENSIGMIDSSMTLFGRLLGGCDTYGAQGRIRSGRASGSILRREI